MNSLVHRRATAEPRGAGRSRAESTHRWGTMSRRLHLVVWSSADCLRQPDRCASAVEGSASNSRCPRRRERWMHGFRTRGPKSWPTRPSRSMVERPAPSSTSWGSRVRASLARSSTCETVYGRRSDAVQWCSRHSACTADSRLRASGCSSTAPRGVTRSSRCRLGLGVAAHPSLELPPRLDAQQSSASLRWTRLSPGASQ